MIVRSKPTVWQLFSLFRLSIVPRIAPQLATVFLFACGVAALECGAFWQPPSPGWRLAMFRLLSGWNVGPFTLLGVALSIFVGFRNNACYDRWWEARRQLGSLIGEMRSLARLAVTLPGADRARRERMVRVAIGYAYALMAHLRQTAMPAEVQQYASAALRSRLGETRDVPGAMLHGLATDCAAMLAEGECGEQIYRLFEDRLNAFAAIQVACERIRGTPTPFPYTLLLNRTAYAYCFLLPFGLVSTMGWGTPLFCSLVAYAFFGLDALGDELEEPFGASLNALPLDAMARTIEISLLEALGVSPLPKPLQPVRSVLR